VAAVWLVTGVLVLHPSYRAEGARWLALLGIPAAVMWVTCIAEIALGLRVGLGTPRPWLAAVQTVAVLGFSLILVVLDPLLLADPFGVITKNVPLLAVVLVTLWLHEEGWTTRSTRVLRFGMAIIWVTEGLLPKILFQQPQELAVVAGSGMVPFDPSIFLRGMGLAQILSGIGALTLRGRALRLLLWCQILALVLLPLLVSIQRPLLWVHPFGPLTKNLPILAGTLVLVHRLARQSSGGKR
ncbi:MAG: hypothetical protein GXP62_05015, partial [Oligoflexia bacterium]|nr:hypothetical protein [Oligoflexia bacterium]